MSVQLEEWINKAEQDWQAALHQVEGRPEEAPDVIAFHAQQTAEKYLKALPVQVGEGPPCVHSLGAFLDAVAVYQPEAEFILGTPYLFPAPVFCQKKYVWCPQNSVAWLMTGILKDVFDRVRL